MTTPVTAPVVWSGCVVVTDDHGRLLGTVRAGLHYHPARPYEVRLTTSGDDTPWTFSRDLLADGCAYPAGLGDVQVWPVYRSWPAGDDVRVRLSSPYGTGVLTLPGDAVRRFVADTLLAVERGAERMDVDADRWLAGMTGGAS